MLLYGCGRANEPVANPAEEAIKVAVNFETPSGFLDENAIQAFEEMDRIIAFVQADGYIENVEKGNYYSFGESVEYKTY